MICHTGLKFERGFQLHLGLLQFHVNSDDLHFGLLSLTTVK